MQQTSFEGKKTISELWFEMRYFLSYFKQFLIFNELQNEKSNILKGICKKNSNDDLIIAYNGIIFFENNE